MSEAPRWAIPKWEDFGNRRFALNPVLLNRQKIDEDTYRLLIQSHRWKFDLLDLMECLNPVRDRERLRRLADLIDRVEYMQQVLWGFSLDPDFHMFWIVPHCTCPKAANEYLWGVPGSIVALGCPIHWRTTRSSLPSV